MTSDTAETGGSHSSSGTYRKRKPKDLYECERGHRTIVRSGKNVRDTCLCGAENMLTVENQRHPHQHVDTEDDQ